MKHDEQLPGADRHDATGGTYRPPTVTVLGTLAELTQKDVGAADGATFLGIDIGS